MGRRPISESATNSFVKHLVRDELLRWEITGFFSIFPPGQSDDSDWSDRFVARPLLYALVGCAIQTCA
jgi:hypothetical protein